MLRVEINEIDGRKAIEIINQTVSCFFGNRNKIDKSLARLTNEKRKRTQIYKIINKNGIVILIPKKYKGS